MRPLQITALALLAASLCLHTVATAQPPAAESKTPASAEHSAAINRTACRENGFTGRGSANAALSKLTPIFFLSVFPPACIHRLSAEDLSCATCDKLAAAVTSKQLAAECAGCCLQTERSIELFARAILVYDKNYVHVFPEVDSFLAGKAQSQFRNLSVQVLRPSHLSSFFPPPIDAVCCFVYSTLAARGPVY
jgi:hypothetical protein